jgi:hypothetical protein
MKSPTLFILLLFTSFLSSAQSTSLYEDFSTCISNLPGGWQKYNVNGAQTWQCSTSGQSGQGVSISGYSGGTYYANEDWLISPQLDLSNYTNPMLAFWCRTKFAGAFIQVMVSTNYNSGNPNAATWIILPAILPTSNSDVWFLSDQISLLAYKNQPLHIAFKYTSSTFSGATWRLDDVAVADGAVTISKSFIHTGMIPSGISGDPFPFTFKVDGSITTFSIEVQPPFEISSDGISFFSQLSFNAAIAGITQQAFVRFRPQIPDKVFRDQISFRLNGNPLPNQIYLLGVSMPVYNTLSMCTWNMKWFGDPDNCDCDTNTSRILASQLLKDLQADIYCLQEVVSIPQLSAVCNSLGADYAYLVSPFCSFASTTTSSSYAGGQKLAYIYNTKKVTDLGSFGLLASTYPSDTSSASAYYCFASGRFPFVLQAGLKLAAGQVDTLIVTNLHAKANADMSSYDRRLCGAFKMTDSLNTLFPGKKIAILGDYNDYLEGSTLSLSQPSPYTYLLNQGFEGLTLPSLFPGQTTYIGIPGVIDNIVCSNTLLPDYADSTCFIFSEAEKYIVDYRNRLSDHLPVMSYFKFDFPNAVTPILSQPITGIQIVNPSSNTLSLFHPGKTESDCQLSIFTLTGDKIVERDHVMISDRSQVAFPELPAGMYMLQITTGQQTKVFKWMIQE